MTVRPEARVGPSPTPAELAALRVRVGWDANEPELATALERHHAVATARDGDGRLVGFAAAVSDGVRHAFVIDVMVDPACRRRGLGVALVEALVARLRDDGLRTVHVDFVPEHRAFYERCGFGVGLAGIRELASTGAD